MHRHAKILLGISLTTLVACGDDDPVEPPPELRITTSSLPAGNEDMDYRAEVTATGGSGEGYRWSLVDGGLPAGVFLRSQGTPSTVIAGRPRGGGRAAFTLRVTDSTGNEATAELEIRIQAEPPGVEITTSMLPMASITQAYTATVTARNGQSYEWSVRRGRLPTGLTLSPSASSTAAVTISGMPSEVGRFAFTLRVVDAAGNRSEADYTIEVVDDRPPLELLPARLPEATVSVAYTFDFVARGGSLTGYTWTVASGELPPGLTLAEEGTPNATLSGTPTERGSYSFRIEVEDSEGNRARETFFVEVTPAPRPLRIVTFELPNGRVGNTYTSTVRAVNGSRMGYTWSVAQGSLPPGLSLTSGTPSATLSGSPTQAGSYEFLLRVEDSIGSRSEQLYRIDIAERIIPVTITATNAQNGVLVLPNAEGGQPYTATLEAQDGAPIPPTAGSSEVRYNWVVTGGSLPPGLSLNPAGQGANDVGTFTGIPTALGVYTATVTVYDRLNNTDDQVIQITVDPPSEPLRITTTSLPDLPATGCYSGQITATGGGNAGFTWRVVNGSLPPGVTLESSGTPTTRLGGAGDSPPATSTFTVEVTDTFGLSAQQQLTISLDPNARGPERWAAYVADQDIDNQFDIYVQDLCAPAVGTPTRVNGASASGDVSTSSNDVKLSPAGNALAFIGDLDTAGQEEVYVVDLRNGPQTGEAVRILDAASSFQEAIDLRWSPDGSKIGIRYDSTSGRNEMWVADVSNLSAPQQAVLVSQPGTSSSEDVYNEYGFSPDGNWIAWIGDTGRSNQDEIFVVDLSGSTPGAPQSCAPSGITTSREVERDGFLWTPDSRGVIYTADITDSFDPDLYFCDVSTTPVSVTAFPGTTGGTDISGNRSMEEKDHMSFSADGTRFAHIGDIRDRFEDDVYVYAYANGSFTGRTTVVQAPSSSDTRFFRWAPSGYQILAVGDLANNGEEELFLFDGGPSASGNQSRNALKNATSSQESGFSFGDFGFSPDGTQAITIGDYDTNGAEEIFLIDLTGSSPSDVQLNQNHTSGSNDVFDFQFTADGSGVVFRADTVSSNNELWYASTTGTAPARAVRLHPTLASGQDVFEYAIPTGGNSVLFRGDVETSGDNGAYIVDLSDGEPGTLQALTGSALSSGRDVNRLLVR